MTKEEALVERDDMQIDGGGPKSRQVRADPAGFDADYLKIYYGNSLIIFSYFPLHNVYCCFQIQILLKF